MSRIKRCNYCKSELNKETAICPICNKKQSNTFHVAILSIILTLIVIIIFGTSSHAPASKNSVTNLEAEQIHSTNSISYKEQGY